MVRVCLVLSQFHPRESGAEKQARLQGRELVRRGHVVHVVTQFLPGHPRDEFLDGIQVHRWVRPIRRGPLFGLTFVQGMVSALRSLKHEYDLIHTHQALWESISTGAARPWLGSRPTLVQPASAGYYGEAQEMARTKGFAWLRRLALRNTAFAAISGAIEREWLELGVPPRRMIRTASGVDTDHFSPGEPPAELERELPYRPRAIFTGRLHPQKNLERLLEAWTKLETPATLLLLGEGLDRPRLEQLASGLGLGERVRFVGAVGDPAPWLKASDLFLLPSVAEGMSNSLLEAMATGLPCLVSAIGGNLDLISDGETGRVVSGGDAASWARAIDETLSDRALARTWGANALRRVTSEYSLSTITSRYETLYARLLAES